MRSSCPDPDATSARSRAGRLVVVALLGAAALVGTRSPGTTAALLTDQTVVSLEVQLPGPSPSLAPTANPLRTARARAGGEIDPSAEDAPVQCGVRISTESARDLARRPDSEGCAAATP